MTGQSNLIEIDLATSKHKEIIDITDNIASELDQLKKSPKVCLLFCPHTSCAISCADLDPGTDLDILDAFDKIVPNLRFRHPHNPLHVKDHILSTLIGPDLMLLVKSNKLMLGEWQRIVLIEFNGPRKRNLLLNFL